MKKKAKRQETKTTKAAPREAVEINQEYAALCARLGDIDVQTHLMQRVRTQILERVAVLDLEMRELAQNAAMLEAAKAADDALVSVRDRTPPMSTDDEQ